MTYFSRLGLRVEKGLLQLGQLFLVAAHGLQVLGLVGVVGRFHFFQRDFFVGVVRGADLRWFP